MMTDIVERLNENIISDAFERRAIIDGALCERLIRERKEAAETIEKLHREAAIRIDQIEREQEAHLETIADYNWAAVENEKLRLALKPFVKLQATIIASCNGAPDDYLIAENLPCGILRAAAAAIRESEAKP